MLETGILEQIYESDSLREWLKKRDIELIFPYRKNSKNRRYEDEGRPAWKSLRNSCWNLGSDTNQRMVKLC